MPIWKLVFGVICVLLIVGLTIVIGSKIKKAALEHLKNQVSDIGEKYPLAYNDYLAKNNISIDNADKNDLKGIVHRSIEKWNQEEIELKKQEEEKRKKVEEEKKKKAEEEERKRKEDEERMRIEQLGMLHQEGSIRYKEDKDEIIRILKDNGIRCFYHLTAFKNLESIRRLGGLYSLYYMAEKGNARPITGGSEYSLRSDIESGAADYVHLSYCREHPMFKDRIRIKQLYCLLTIDIEVATWEDTIFTNMNALDSLCNAGIDADFLKQWVCFDAVKRKNVCENDLDYKPHQAEIMVRNNIPKEYILNLHTKIPLLNASFYNDYRDKCWEITRGGNIYNWSTRMSIR